MLTSGYSAQAVLQEGGPDVPLIKKPYRLAELVRRIGEVSGRAPDLKDTAQSLSLPRGEANHLTRRF